MKNPEQSQNSVTTGPGRDCEDLQIRSVLLTLPHTVVAPTPTPPPEDPETTFTLREHNCLVVLVFSRRLTWSADLEDACPGLTLPLLV